MEELQSLHDFEPIRTLSDPRRMTILRQLMQRAATLTQLAHALETYPAKVRHHVKQLEAAGLIQLVRTEVNGGVVEKYYQATARAYMVQAPVLPADVEPASLLLMGSHDLALEQLIAQVQQLQTETAVYALPVGSLDGLIALRQGVCQLAGAHLQNAAGDNFNSATVQHLFPSQAMRLLTLVHRLQGLIVQPGNPYQLHDVADLLQPGLLFVNRQPGAGTRIWLERQLQQIPGAPPMLEVTVAHTHHEVAAAVARGRADVGLGVLAAAQAYGLDFVPLFEERYDLIVPKASERLAGMQPLLEQLQTAVFRKAVRALEGYDVTHTGESQIII